MKNKLYQRIFVVEIVIMLAFMCIIPHISGIENKNIRKNINEYFYQEKIIFDEYILNPTDDVYIKHNKPNNNCNIEYISIRNEFGGNGHSGFGWDGLIKFDLSEIPEAEIESANLKLYFFEFEGVSPVYRKLYLYRALNDWNESTITWKTQPSYDTESSSVSAIPSPQRWMTWDVTNDIQDFIDGHIENYGWKITDEEYWGVGNIPTTIFRSKEYGTNIPYLEIKIQNNPPFKPYIDGPNYGMVDQTLTYEIFAIDPNNDDVFFWIEWFQGCPGVFWQGPYESGEVVEFKYTWETPGNHVIKVKAKDNEDAESDVATLSISIPRTKATYDSFFMRLLDSYPLLKEAVLRLIR